MRERDSFRKRNLLTRIENLIAKEEAEKDNLPYEEYKTEKQYIRGYIAGLEEARRIIKGVPSSGWRPSAVHQRLVERRKKERIRAAGEQ
jgi:predicted metal-dependent peptidase